MFTVLAVFAILCFVACNEPAANKKEGIVRKAPLTESFHFDSARKLLTAADFSDPAKRRILLAVNRTDSQHFVKMDSVIVPADLSGDLAFYFPFPFSVPYLSKINKLIFFSYPAQAFAAYENGELVYTGPVNMGRKKDPTPTGLYYTNWKAEKTTSTFNDEWELEWNFNIHNKEGIGWHQYELPGYPASHSCLRLLEADARYLYTWADQWVLDDKDNITLKGTPVIVFGKYDFDGAKPWWQLAGDPRALDINAGEIESLVKPHYNEIVSWQDKRIAAGK